MVAAEESEIESFFSHFVPLSRVKESLNALAAMRELRHLRVKEQPAFIAANARGAPLNTSFRVLLTVSPGDF